MNLVFHTSEDGSEIELKHCASSKTSVKSSRKYFVHLNWIRLATNPSWLDSSIGRASGGLETRRCEFKSRSRQRIFRCRLQRQINMNLIFHISEDGSEIDLFTFLRVHPLRLRCSLHLHTLLRSVRSASFSTKICATSVLSSSQAICNGVFPSMSRQFGSVFCFNKMVTIFE